MAKPGAGAVAEFIGTFALTFFGAGAIILTSSEALAGLGMKGAPGGLLTVALAHGLILFCFVAGCAYISGGQFNPAVSLGLVIAGKQKPGTAGVYIVAQLLGAACAAGMLQLFLTPPVANHDVPMLGATIGALTKSGNLGAVIGIETILTASLVFVVLTTAVDKRGGVLGPQAIGMTVTACILAAGPLTGASMNPARSFGPAVCGGHWTMFHAYIIGPCLGAIVAALVYRVFWDENASQKA
ncbi:MAG: aquaporin [Phycisphaerales bacterium]|nr:aquaporin [Phycisphaerales bacterium]